MSDATRTFNRLRPRLHGIAYRMLGSSAEAEEVVQDAWLRWHEADQARLDSSEGWLVAVTTRLAIDRLRTAKVQREHYIGTWLPEPLLSDTPVTPEQLLERADDVSVAFLTMLERLTPEARAAFLLREVFDADYGEVSQPPLNGMCEVAGPQSFRLDELIRGVLRAGKDPREVITNDDALYFGTRLADESLPPGPGVRVGATSLVHSAPQGSGGVGSLSRS